MGHWGSNLWEGEWSVVTGIHDVISPSRFEIRGFPTIKLFRGGQVAAEYNGERTADALFSYMSSPPAAPKTEL